MRKKILSFLVTGAMGLSLIPVGLAMRADVFQSKFSGEVKADEDTDTRSNARVRTTTTSRQNTTKLTPRQIRANARRAGNPMQRGSTLMPAGGRIKTQTGSTVRGHTGTLINCSAPGQNFEVQVYCNIGGVGSFPQRHQRLHDWWNRMHQMIHEQEQLGGPTTATGSGVRP